MARIRTIKPEFWESERLGRLSVEARLNFLGLISLADDEGRGKGASDFLFGRLHPYSLRTRRGLFEDSLRDLVTAGVVVFYDVEGCKYYWIKNFAEHQRIDRPTKSKIPPVPLDEPSTNDRRALDPSSKGEGKGMDQGREGKGEEAIRRVLDEEGGARRFAPPPLPTLEAYWSERGLRGDPEEFLDFYASKGWRVGNAPMRDWKSAARNWSRRERAHPGNGGPRQGGHPTPHREQYLELERRSREAAEAATAAEGAIEKGIPNG